MPAATAPAGRAASPFVAGDAAPLPRAKFVDLAVTADGSPRATVEFRALETLWFNTGTRCNLSCLNCYIESTPRNDALSYLTLAEATGYLDEIRREGMPTRTVGFTGGEPFLNRDLPAMLELTLERGFEALVLTNAMRPMRRREAPLLALHRRFPDRLQLRVSLDHHTAAVHEAERGEGSWAAATEGLRWLANHGFPLAVAGRRLAGEGEAAARLGYARLFSDLGVPIDAADPRALPLFPEMDAAADVPEITQSCWGLLKLDPGSPMCATSRMVERSRGAAAPHVVSCTLIPHDPRFALGPTLEGASRRISLAHPHCARFCVLGGASCGG